MYGKLFAQMYDGTLATKGPWEALVTFQQLIILADKNGVVDMTPEAIARRTTIPLEIVLKGLENLQQPDDGSRTPTEEGRRITPLSDSRDWGWQIVNYEHYRNLRSSDERREYHRQYYHQKRKLQTVSTISTDSTDSTDSTKAVSSKHKHKNIPPPSGAFLKFWGLWPKGERKVARGKCWEIWMKKDFDQVAEQILTHVEVLKGSEGWRGGFSPMPITYLNQRQWEGAEMPEKPTGPQVAL